MMPGITHWPVASNDSRPAGGAPRPTKAILPSDTATKPFLIIRSASTRLPATTRSKSAIFYSSCAGQRLSAGTGMPSTSKARAAVWVAMSSTVAGRV